MYQKIQGLKKLEKLNFPVPPYKIIEFKKYFSDIDSSTIKKEIEGFKIPYSPGFAIGVTIRVSLPTKLDKEGSHGGLHNLDRDIIAKKIIEKIRKYGPDTKIILQYTIDAKSSGAIIGNDRIVIEAIPGDNPELLEGKTRNIERWEYDYQGNSIFKKVSYTENGKPTPVLSTSDLSKLIYYIRKAIENANNKKIYLEWSISKDGDLYFYEYREIP